jgi:lambda family phage minor tail protein L
MTVQADLFSPSTSGGLVELFTLDASQQKGGFIFHFANGVNQFGLPLLLNAVPFTPLTCKGEGWARTVNGAAPRPTFSVDNTQRLMQAAMITNGSSFVGAKLIRTRIFGKYLDAANFKAGNPTADPTKILAQETWYVDQLKSINDTTVQWELCWTIDRPGVQIPRRKMLKPQFPGLGMNS